MDPKPGKTPIIRELVFQSGLSIIEHVLAEGQGSDCAILDDMHKHGLAIKKAKVEAWRLAQPFSTP
ncbi:MAG TPA: hypothetical protein VNN62_18965 [Methylomirabilota bacterium]|nr:hypothetical protein [Methylomirabilota bacterium]